MDHLRLWNFTKSQELPENISGPVARFSTCLRTLFFSYTPCSELGPAPLQDRAAYEFLMQVLCGLESPVFGETEVFGQFKVQAEGFPKELQSLTQMILADVKSVRHKHLKDLGGSTYGSLAREFLGRSELVVMVGAGQLAHEVYPWLAKTSASLMIAVRSLRPFGLSMNAETEVRLIKDLKNIVCDLVLVAPLTNQEIAAWVDENQITIRKCLDFRTSKQAAGLRFGEQSLDLSEIFENLRRNREDHSQVRDHAMAEISLLIEKRLNQASLRPFGWEDLCV